MNRESRRTGKAYSNKEFREVDEAFIFDGSSGLYKPKTYYSEQKAEQGTNKNPITIKVLRDWLPIIISALTLVLLGATVYFAHLQWFEMQRTADESVIATQTADKTLKVSQRAWLIPVNAEMVDFENNKDFRLIQFVYNNGPTPAKNVAIDGQILKWQEGHKIPAEKPFDEKPAKPKGILVRSSGGYKVVFHWNEVSKSMVIDQKTIDEIRSETLQVRLYGKVWYDDIFDHPHWVKFCSQYDWEEKAFLACESGNGMDADQE